MKNINEMTLEELKIAAYDTMANIQYLQAQLQSINEEIAKKVSAPAEGKEKKK